MGCCSVIVQAAWLHAVEAWLNDQALIEVHKTLECYSFLAYPRTHQMVVKTPSVTGWLLDPELLSQWREVHQP